ncbi:hypothetical protein Ssi02_65620 [Sinosporangium siamense]|uniref:Uncharacterized protein n=1 Tax=Sinosporangium siamense TaxID=1367973 RepID=A0A919VAC9_9ACTN|nr:hypothetical protein Ssi02_65620 [Sinosporangium siamense]
MVLDIVGHSQDLTTCPRTNHGRTIKGLITVGYSKKRIGINGKPRYTACYLDLRGVLRSAGTFTNKKDALISQNVILLSSAHSTSERGC